MIRRATGAAALLLLLPALCTAQTATFQFVPTGAMRIMGGYRPQLLKLSAVRPTTVHKIPAGVQKALWGDLVLGPTAHPKHYAVLVDVHADGGSRLFVDANANGNLTDDPATEWNARPYPGNSPMHLSMGGASVNLTVAGKATPAHLGMYMFDPRDTNRPQLKDTLLYYCDYAADGKVQLGSKTYHAMLVDALTKGSFDAAKEGRLLLYIDVDGNGRFANIGEIYDASKPFNIGGTTWNLARVAPDGTSARFAVSAQKVAEILPPPDLSAGHKALAFEAKTTDGKTVHFPADFAGKVVLLDFWATWCGPCRAELPNVITAYNKYHDKGFEILGISLDQPNSLATLTKFTTDNKMAWAQVYDGGYWKAAVAQQYGVEAIPQAYLVDADTGNIIAEGNSIRGEALDKAVSGALANHHNK